MKPPFTYYGGKVGMAERIVGMLPPHRVYIEPFFGSGAVLFAKPPSMHEIVNDLDNVVVTFFRVLRERMDELAEVCALTPYARAEYEAAVFEGTGGGLDDLELARRFWVRVNQSFAKTAGRRTGWSVTTARTQAAPASVRGRLARFAECAERLATVSIECCDAASLVTRLATPDAVVYADPPYLPSTRNGRGRVVPAGTADDYRVDMGEDDHRRLAEVLTATPAAVILSGYPSDLYEDLYRGWWHVDVAVSVHSSNSVTVDRGRRIERLWSNRPLDLGQLAFAEATP